MANHRCLEEDSPHCVLLRMLHAFSRKTRVVHLAIDKVLPLPPVEYTFILPAITTSLLEPTEESEEMKSLFRQNV